MAKRTGRSKTFYAREAILAYLEDIEDYYRAEGRMGRFDASKTIPLEDVLKRYRRRS